MKTPPLRCTRQRWFPLLLAAGVMLGAATPRPTAGALAPVNDQRIIISSGNLQSLSWYHEALPPAPFAPFADEVSDFRDITGAGDYRVRVEGGAAQDSRIGGTNLTAASVAHFRKTAMSGPAMGKLFSQSTFALTFDLAAPHDYAFEGLAVIETLGGGVHASFIALDAELAGRVLSLGSLGSAGLSNAVARTGVLPAGRYSLFARAEANEGSGQGHGTATNYFSLVLTPVPPTPVSNLTLHVSEVTVCWPSVPNAFYQVQFRSELDTNGWADLGSPLPGNGSTNCYADPVPAGAPRRFYRVLQLP